MLINIVKVNDLHKSFDDLVVLNGVSLNVEMGQNMVVFGRSGTGKSVLLKCLMRLMIPDSGEIFIEDKNVLNLNHKELNELRKDIGFLFQGSALYDSMTVRENLEFPLIRNFSLEQDEINDRIYRVLEAVDLSDAIDKMPSELSGGMRKRVGLARSIITNQNLCYTMNRLQGLIL